MTTVVVLADPPEEGLSNLVERTTLSKTDASDLYAALLADVCTAVNRSGADLLVNYPDEDAYETVADPEQAVRSVVEDGLGTTDDVRFEVQVGSSHAARVGNAITHLLERESVTTAAALDPTAALVTRSDVDGAAMKLRSSEVVLGPAPGGRVYYAGFADPVDFEDAYATPAVETLTERARDADLDVDFLSMQPVVRSADDVLTVLTMLRARRAAGRPVPERTVDVLTSLDLRVESDGDGRTTLGR